VLSARVSSETAGAPPFDLTVHFYESGIARVRLVEVTDKPPR
jgi:hypothetical protein